MEISEAKAVVLDPESSFTDKYYAVAAIIGNPSVRPEDLLDCLDVGGVSAEAAATKLHTLTGRDADNGVLGIYLDRQDWEEYLNRTRDYDYELRGYDYEYTLKLAQTTTSRRLLLAVLISFLMVAGSESVACGDLLNAPNQGLTSLDPRGATSRLVPSGGLAAHEAAGGHLIARHIGKTDADLAARLAAQPRISGASSFGSRTLAENAVSSAIDANQTAIRTWLSGSGNRLVLNHNTGEVIGRSLSRGAASAVDARSVRVVLQRDPSFPGGFRIITGFPTL